VTALTQSRRLALDFIIAFALMGFYLSGVYARFPGPVQLISLKVVLVSMAFIHAHLVGKIAFGFVDWTEGLGAKAALRIALYVVFIYAYSTGG